MMPMRDGVRLATDVYLPVGGTPPFPTLLFRTPYGRANSAEQATEVINTGLATMVIVQDTRGRYGSEGTDCVFRCERGEGLGDGLDTTTWIRAQAWSNGRIVTDGGSALGIAQYMAAPVASANIEAMFVPMATPSFYEHALFQGGVFRQSLAEGWLEMTGSSFFLDDIRAHPLRDGFWDPVETRGDFASVDVPTVHVGGWYDIFTQGTLDAFMGYQHSGGPRARGAQKLIMGPWVHGGQSLDGVQGELIYPENSSTPDLWADWMMHYSGLALRPDVIAETPAVQYYVMGDVDDPAAPGNEWRQAEDWPVPASPIRFYLGTDGALSEACPASTDRTTRYRYDPADPSPTVGGANLILPAGPYDQRAVEGRADNIVFETAVLSEAHEVTGRVRAHLILDVDVPDTAVIVRLTDVYPDGRSMLVLDGAARLATRAGDDHLELLNEADQRDGTLVELDVDLWSTSIIFAAGHRIRISITGSNSPRFRIGPNDGTSYGEAATPRVAIIGVHHALGEASYVELPSPPRFGEAVHTCGAMMAVDGGPASLDGATAAADAGGGEPAKTGCSCRAAGAEMRRDLSAACLLVLLIGLRRRRG